MKRIVALPIALLVALVASGCTPSGEPVEDQVITLPSDSGFSETATGTDEPIEGPAAVEEEFDKNKADANFVSRMIPYLYQGIEMNILAERNTTNMDLLIMASTQTSTNGGQIAVLDKYFWDWSLPYFQGETNAEGAAFVPKRAEAEEPKFILVHGGDGVDHVDNNYLVDENPIYAEDYSPQNYRLMAGMLSDTEMIAMFNATESDFDKLWIEGAIARHQGAIAIAEIHQADGIHPILLDISKQIIDVRSAEIAKLEGMLN